MVPICNKKTKEQMLYVLMFGALWPSIILCKPYLVVLAFYDLLGGTADFHNFHTSDFKFVDHHLDIV